MKIWFVLFSPLLLSACIFSSSSELKRAELRLAQFECHNVESGQVVHSPITVYHERTLANSKKNAQDYIEQYKNGEKTFHVPLDEMVGQQQLAYKAACQSLGGIYSE